MKPFTHYPAGASVQCFASAPRDVTLGTASWDALLPDKRANIEMKDGWMLGTGQVIGKLLLEKNSNID